MRNLIEIKSLKKVYHNNANNDVLALNNLSINIPKNKISILIGESGCGKTTLLNIISGIEEDYTGELIFPQNNQKDIIVSSLSQHYTLFPWRNILNNVAFSLEVKGEKKITRLNKARKLLKKVGLSGIEKSYPHELSGGMRQRVALAQALVRKPDLLLLDEPFGALDNATRTELQKTSLNWIKENNITAILVTHNIEEAILLADHLFVLSTIPENLITEQIITLPYPRNPLSKEFTSIASKIITTCKI